MSTLKTEGSHCQQSWTFFPLLAFNWNKFVNGKVFFLQPLTHPDPYFTFLCFSFDCFFVRYTHPVAYYTDAHTVTTQYFLYIRRKQPNDEKKEKKKMFMEWWAHNDFVILALIQLPIPSKVKYKKKGENKKLFRYSTFFRFFFSAYFVSLRFPFWSSCVFYHLYFISVVGVVVICNIVFSSHTISRKIK